MGCYFICSFAHFDHVVALVLSLRVVVSRGMQASDNVNSSPFAHEHCLLKQTCAGNLNVHDMAFACAFALDFAACGCFCICRVYFVTVNQFFCSS